MGTSVVSIAGAVLVGGVLLRAVILLATTLANLRFDRRRRRLELDLLTQRIEAARKRREAAVSAEATWAGLRKFEVQRKVLEGDGVASLYLVPHDRKPLPTFLPGQFLTFQVKVAGRPKPEVRCYSLSDAPGKDHYRVTIKKVVSASGAPGLVSSWFVDQVAEGDIVDLRAPAGHFTLDLDSPAPVVLVGGGIGITPLVSMLNAICARPGRRDVWVFYGVRNGEQHTMREALATATRDHDNVRLHVCYSQPAPKDEKGRDYQHAGRISADFLRRILPSSNFKFYVCGPPALMQTLVPDLQSWGVPKEDIHFEAFGPATVKEVTKRMTRPGSAAAEKIQITFRRSNKTCSWDGTCASILELADVHGVKIESGCRVGNCGTCLAAVTSGEVKYSTDPSAKVEAGSCLTCIAQPTGPLVLDA